MATFSFDIVSDYDKAEMNNVFGQTEREISTRYDFRGTPAAIEWIGDKTGIRLVGENEWQLDAILDIIRKKLAGRGVSSSVLDLSNEAITSNLKASKEIPFKKGLSQDDAKAIAKLVRETVPKTKPQIQGDLVRVSGSSKDDLQSAMAAVKGADFDMPLQFVNYR